jgi:hypothetical protein
MGGISGIQRVRASLPQGYDHRHAGVTIGERRGVHAGGLGLGLILTSCRRFCKFRVRKRCDAVSVAPMGGAELEREMTKTQQRDAATARKAVALGMPDLAARTLSAAHRAAMRAADKRELEALARELGITGQRDWIICG